MPVFLRQNLLGGLSFHQVYQLSEKQATCDYGLRVPWISLIQIFVVYN